MTAVLHVLHDDPPTSSNNSINDYSMWTRGALDGARVDRKSTCISCRQIRQTFIYFPVLASLPLYLSVKPHGILLN